MREVDGEEYRSSFIDEPIPPDKTGRIHKEAYKIANENRKFEIENYWKRANYYWLFQAAVYAGYFYAVTAKNKEYLCQNPEIIAGITCLGFITALAWYLTNRGSKQWQENWEKHIIELENKIAGPLYKTVCYKETWSVSKINKLVSLLSVISWVLLGLKTIHSFFCYPLAFIAYLLVISLIASVFYFFGKSSMDKHGEIQWFRIGDE